MPRKGAGPGSYSEKSSFLKEGKLAGGPTTPHIPLSSVSPFIDPIPVNEGSQEEEERDRVPSPFSRSSSTAVKLVSNLTVAPSLIKSASCMDPQVKQSKICSEHSSTAGSAAADN